VDKKILEDMGFEDEELEPMTYRGKDFQISTTKFNVFRLRIHLEDIRLFINTKFDLEQLLKILGE